MKLSAAVIALLAFVIAVVPFVTNCHYEGKDLLLADGRQVPMRCYWTARAAIVPSAMLMVLAGMLAFSRHGETRRVLAALGALLGVLVILLPTRLLGTCAMPAADCNLIMKPILLVAGVLLTGTGLAALVQDARHSEYVQRPGRSGGASRSTRQRNADRDQPGRGTHL